MARAFKSSLLFLFAAFGTLCPIPMAAQSLPAKKEVREWARKALEMSNLQSAGATPYHLVASFHYVLTDKTFDGTYEVLWAAPDRYRVEFRVGAFGETDLVLGNKKYVQRNTPTMTIPMFSVASMLFPAFPDADYSWPLSLNSVRKIVWAGHDSTQQLCAAFQDNPAYDAVLCFSANQELQSLRIQPPEGGAVSSIDKSIYLSEYGTVGNMRFPRLLTRRVGPESVDITVKEWEVAEKFDSSVFSPLTNASLWDWCAKPEIRDPQPMGTPSSYFAILGGTMPRVLAQPSVFYEVIGPDGTPKRVELLLGAPDGQSNDMLDTLRRAASWVRVCGGKPVAYERIITMWPASAVQ